jgi:hypothetical protein
MKTYLTNEEYLSGVRLEKLFIPYKYNRKTKYNTPNPNYIDKNNFKEKLPKDFLIIKLMNSIPNIEYQFIEYDSGDKELIVKTNYETISEFLE